MGRLPEDCVAVSAERWNGKDHSAVGDKPCMRCKKQLKKVRAWAGKFQLYLEELAPEAGCHVSRQKRAKQHPLAIAVLALTACCLRAHCKTADEHLEKNVRNDELDALRLMLSTRLFDLVCVLRIVQDYHVEFCECTAPRTGHCCAGQHDEDDRWGNKRSCVGGSV